MTDFAPQVEGREAPAQEARRVVDTGARLFLRTVIARAYPRVIGQQRDKTWIFFDTFLPFVGTAGYVYVYRAMGAPEDFIGFAVVGGAMTAFWVNVMWNMSAQLYWDKETGNLPLYIMGPAPLMAILLGMALGGVLSTTLRAAIILGLGTWLFHVPVSVSSFLELTGVFLLSMSALYGLGMVLSSLFLLFGRGVWNLTQVLHEPIYFVAGFYFPVKSFGAVAAYAASILPLTLGLDALRQLTFKTGPSLGLLPVRVEVALLAALTVGFIAAARVCLARMERLAIQEGSLGERRR